MTILSALVAQAGVAGEAARGGYEIERSLRFNSADSAYLNRTFGTSTNQSIFTYSVWVKLARAAEATTNYGMLIAGRTASTDTGYGALEIYNGVLRFGGWASLWRVTTQVFRDPSAWYHIVLAVDTTQATAANSIKLYLNGAEITAFGTSNNPTQNATVGINNNSTAARLGSDDPLASSRYWDGYQTEINFIDGQALTPTSFGEFNTDTGVWQPIEYTGSYGTNGFYLNFSDNSTTDALGTDFSGNGNTWDDNGFSVTAGKDNDSLVDTPTPYGTDTGAGGTVRGNYATLNPLNLPKGGTISNGNLDWTSPTAEGQAVATIYASSGKWYWEILVGTASCGIGIAKDTTNINSTSLETGSYTYYGSDGFKYDASSGASYGSTFTSNDIISIALDLDAGTLVFYKNGVSQGTAFTGLSGNFTALIFEGTGASTNSFTANFGQRPFAYTAPSGFKALCTQNLPEPTIKDGSKYFDAVTYNGNGANVASGGQTISSLDFRPDWVWIKKRTGTPMTNHALFDVVRGANLQLQSNNTFPEFSMTEALVSFTGNGFTLGNSSNVNLSSNAYVAWNWTAGGEPTANNNSDGNIISTVSVNTTSGFSIVTYTGTGSAATVGHGLGAKPSIVIYKRRDSTSDWLVLTDVIDGSMDYGYLNTTSAFGAAGQAAPTSTILNLAASQADSNINGGTFVAYCFAAIPGYSAMGSYVGNGSADGLFVYTGFRPRFVLVKSSSNITNWAIIDTSRSTYNAALLRLRPNSTGAEDSFTTGVDIVSNGFKVRDSTSDWNDSGATYIYMAFSESSFKNSLAR